MKRIHKKISHRCRLLGIAALMLLLGSLSAGQLAVIANKSVPVSRLDKRTLQEIYSLSMQRWEDGSAITVVTMKGNDGVVKRFHQFIGRTPFELRKIWLRAQLSGESSVPIALSSEAEVAARVAATPGAIGFVSIESVPRGVITIAVIE